MNSIIFLLDIIINFAFTRASFAWSSFRVTTTLTLISGGLTPRFGARTARRPSISVSSALWATSRFITRSLVSRFSVTWWCPFRATPLIRRGLGGAWRFCRRFVFNGFTASPRLRDGFLFLIGLDFLDLVWHIVVVFSKINLFSALFEVFILLRFPALLSFTFHYWIVVNFAVILIINKFILRSGWNFISRTLGSCFRLCGLLICWSRSLGRFLFRVWVFNTDLELFAKQP